MTRVSPLAAILLAFVPVIAVAQKTTPAKPAAPKSKASAAAPNESQLREMKRAMEATAQDSNRSRMTAEALKEERIGLLRQKDPALGVAIDELDLELLD